MGTVAPSVKIERNDTVLYKVCVPGNPPTEALERGGGGDSKQRRSIMSRDPTMQISKDYRTEDKARTSESGFRLATRSELGVATFG